MDLHRYKCSGTKSLSACFAQPHKATTLMCLSTAAMVPSDNIVVLRVDLLSVNVGDKTVLQPVLHNSVRCRKS